MDHPVKENKAQRAERLKREKNAWECFAEIERFARDGYESIPPEWLSNYFRPWGVYTQGDGAGALGGVGGEGKAAPYFMVRVRVGSGLLTSQQARVVAGLSEKFGRGVVDITVRQNFQLHWITIEALPELMRELWAHDLTTMSACGDDTRNITGCPLAGVDADEICDASPLVHEAGRMLVGNPEFYNLPRKYKICITGCNVWCSYPEINDVAFTAVRRKIKSREDIGFSLAVGGGLSNEPFLALPVSAFVQWNQVLPVIRGITEIFRESDCLRENRKRARMKYLFLKNGWTAESFLTELERRIGFKLDPAVESEPPADAYRDHVGVHAQKQEGLYSVGVAVLRGRLRAEQLAAAADLAERYGSGLLRNTGMQNFVIVNVPAENVDALVNDLEAADLRVEGSPFWRGTIACSGTEFCKLAVTETKNYATWIVEELERRLPGFNQHVKINITGCPNSCGQHWIADVGIEGKKIKVDGHMIDAYYFCVGGAVGKYQGIARPVGFRCPAPEVPEAMERLFRAFLAEREEGENFRQFTSRFEVEQLRAMLAGAEVEAAMRDRPSGPVPQSLEA